ncbi:uncharacterized protein LOC131209805 [Anopheles bellator]|uniref:uncharacterized protein LOC131209805 n=1 Tax=Anopheles bellator TaxID=139047 RepID=UPI0026479631|nr:uncharacterized protein LOC131209805 [Anopheles bellator]
MYCQVRSWHTVVLLLLGGSMSLPVVLSNKHVDIFEQFGQQNATVTDASTKGDAENLPTPSPNSCVEDVLPSEPVELNEKLEKELEPPSEPPQQQDIAPPNVAQMLEGASPGFSPNIVAMVQKVRKVLTAIKDKLQAYAKGLVAKFEHQRHQAMGRVKQKMDALNAKIKSRFENEFVEYKDVCLPDQNKCMKQLQQDVERYEEQMRTNVDQCNDQLAEELAKQRQSVNDAQQLMDEPNRKIEGCLDTDAGVGRSFIGCAASLTSNLAKVATKTQERFTAQMRKLTDQLAQRVDKHDKCVVKRHQLLNRSERELTDSAKKCLRKQQQQTQPESFF